METRETALALVKALVVQTRANKQTIKLAVPEHSLCLGCCGGHRSVGWFLLASLDAEAGRNEVCVSSQLLQEAGT